MRNEETEMKRGELKVISFRLKPNYQARFDTVVARSKRTKTSIIEECLEVVLPRLERKYLVRRNGNGSPSDKVSK